MRSLKYCSLLTYLLSLLRLVIVDASASKLFVCSTTNGKPARIYIARRLLRICRHEALGGLIADLFLCADEKWCAFRRKHQLSILNLIKEVELRKVKRFGKVGARPDNAQVAFSLAVQTSAEQFQIPGVLRARRIFSTLPPRR